MRKVSRFAAAAAFVALSCGAAAAAPGRLVSEATGFVIEGEIVDFDGASYLIDGPVGRLRVPAAGVRCEGAGCPATPAPGAPLTLVAVSEADLALATRLIEAFALAGGGVAERELGAVGAARFRLYGADGAAGAEFVVESAGAPEAYAALAAGRAELAFASRPPTGAERAAFGLGADRIGLADVAEDGLAFVVAPGHPLRSLSPEQGVRIFAGEIADWSAVGGPAGPIRALAPAGGEEAATLLALVGARGLAETVERTEDLRALADRVAADPSAIGFTALSRTGSARPLAIDEGCGLLLEPDRFAVKAGDWPLALTRRIVTGARKPAEAAAALLAFARSPAASAEIADLGFADLKIEALPVAAQGRRLAEAMLAARGESETERAAAFVRAVAAAERLSTTIRYRPGAARAGDAAEAALEALARHLGEAASGRTVLIAGFADASDGERIPALSEERARRLRSALEDAFERIGAPAPAIRAAGYGDSAPLGCAGDPRNRRAEIWLR